MTDINLADRTTWPEIRSVWQHHNKIRYRVIDYTNIETGRQDKYPTTIIYQNIENYKKYSRPLIDWSRSMTLVET